MESNKFRFKIVKVFKLMAGSKVKSNSFSWVNKKDGT